MLYAVMEIRPSGYALLNGIKTKLRCTSIGGVSGCAESIRDQVGLHALSRRVLYRAVARKPACATVQCAVIDGMLPRLSAGCRRSACPVRRAALGNGTMAPIEAPAPSESCRQPLLPAAYCYRASRRFYLRSQKQFSIGIAEGFNTEAKLTTREAYGFRTFHEAEIALYHTIWAFSVPENHQRIFLRRLNYYENRSKYN